ncbi:acyl-CoA dehydrogenase family protein [Yersinia mollaretii]|uniref:acyl-CoA dehydrogenase family protein n=2 Tax=Yersinia mollaretii TaxID=33060 RepID=UPI0005DF2301|nr:acyl-CoA dehydrogenase family protein [Yersinia mollaretii]MDN0111414.1 acyl-CoA dehydrogenase family protein [Yersinia mollaretii]PJE86157.1 monooxygenase [Yersinia mollaretii]CQH06392.1 Flavin-dependent monooxygenase%2C oxygenase subunit HsaA [Yersinia mollaretii]
MQTEDIISTRKDMIKKARELVPSLRFNAQKVEESRQVSEETMQLFHHAGFFKLLQPARYGGLESSLSIFIEVIAELSRGCISSAWCCSLCSVHQWLVGIFPIQAQQDVWGANPEAIVCGSYAPTMVATSVDGGYVIQGNWKFASNVDNAQWALLGVHFNTNGKNTQESSGFVLVPKKEWVIEDDWFVFGQKGTGSKTIAIGKPIFVPFHRCLTFKEASSGSPPGSVSNHHSIYRIPFLSVVPLGLVSPLLGAAQGAIETLIEQCDSRITRGAVAGSGNKLSQFFPVQSHLAEASALIDAAKLLLLRDISYCEEKVARGDIITSDVRIRNRRDHAFSARMLNNAINILFTHSGGTGLSLNQPMQQIWRDSNAIIQHIGLNWDAVSSMVGQHLIGMEPNGQY